MATLLQFVRMTAPTPRVLSESKVLTFMTRQQVALRDYSREMCEYELWLHRQRRPGARREDPPTTDLMLATLVERSVRQVTSARLFEAVVRTGPPHPLSRLICSCGGVLDRVVRGLHIALLAYYALLGVTAFPLFAGGRWTGGITMASVGSVFAALLIARLRSPAASSGR